MAVLCGMPTIQYSARSARLSVYNLFTSCLGRGLVSRELILDGVWLPATELRQRYLPFYLFTVSNSGLLFFYVVQPAGTAAYLVYSIERRTSPKIWGVFMYGVYRPRE